MKAFDYTGFYRYFLTFCSDRRRRAFISADVVDLVLLQILRAAGSEGFAMDAYCFMPDHVHLLMEAQVESANCLRFIARAKQFSGFHYKVAHGQRLWQRYGFEHVLRSDEDTLSVARYILENPLRAGLVNCVEAYPFGGSKTYPLRAILDAAAMKSPKTSGCLP